MFDDLFVRYYVSARGWGSSAVGQTPTLIQMRGERREAREGGDVGEDKELIRRGGDDTVDAAVGCWGRRSDGRGGGTDTERPPRRTSPRPPLISH